MYIVQGKLHRRLKALRSFPRWQPWVVPVVYAAGMDLHTLLVRCKHLNADQRMGNRLKCTAAQTCDLLQQMLPVA